MTATLRSRTTSGTTLTVLLMALVAAPSEAFVASSSLLRPYGYGSSSSSALAAEDTEKAASVVTGADLEMMLQEWDTPLVLAAYLTSSLNEQASMWCFFSLVQCFLACISVAFEKVVPADQTISHPGSLGEDPLEYIMVVHKNGHANGHANGKKVN